MLGSLKKRRLRKAALAALLAWMMPGCVRDRADVFYLGKEQRNTYKAHATELSYPNVADTPPPQVTGTAPPHTILETDEIPIRDISLAETIQIGLANSQVLRTAGAFLTPTNPLLAVPNVIPSTLDPAIQETGVLFGNRGVEAALSAFDAQVNASVITGKNEVYQNSPFVTNSGVLNSDATAFNASLSKIFANGGSISVNHNVNYLGSNQLNQLYPSTYAGNVGIEYQLPLLAGSGTEFTRIAGPIGQSFGGLTGVSQGVIIARINNDISIADFDFALRVLVRDIEDAYWNLYQAYRNYHTAVTAKDSSLLTWRIADLQLQGGVRTRAEVAQARDQYFGTEAASLNARSNIFSAEIRLRRLIGLAANDGTTLRPLDEPVSAQLIPDWYACLTEALTERVELRRQKWNLKSLELQLVAAKSLVQPRLDFISGYQINGFGDNLAGGSVQGAPNNFYGSIGEADQTGWNLGVQFNWNIGFRSALAQVRNYELRISKAQLVLQEQEKEISAELAVSFQELARAYNTAETNMNRLIAARENVKYLEPNIREGTVLLDELLRAQLRQAEAEVAYYTSLVDYNKALNDLQYRKGTILRHNAIFMAEGPWCPEAYLDAQRIADERNHARETDKLEAIPEPFSTQAPVGGVFFTNPEAAPGFAPTPAAELADPQAAMDLPPRKVDGDDIQN
ncbi:TolC family protein [Planctomicrobium sp. SH664]|uniref:TolC family protein n=1 Tax=Planctomicrobium sp. SH664 TaxID=3448125 RepID=UPI003F5BBB6E